MRRAPARPLPTAVGAGRSGVGSDEWRNAMFELKIGPNLGYSGAFTIKNCPKVGLAALDFRRAHNLPDGTHDSIYVPYAAVASERYARKCAHLLDGCADLYAHSKSLDASLLAELLAAIKNQNDDPAELARLIAEVALTPED